MDHQEHLKGLNSLIMEEKDSKNMIEEEKESNNYYQSNIPQSISMDVPLHFSNFINSHLSTSTPSYSCIEESKDTKVFNISRTKSNSVEKLDKINHSPREKFTPFSDYKVSYMIEHLQRPIWNHHGRTSLAKMSCSSFINKFNKINNVDNCSDDQVGQVLRIRESKCMLTMINDIVIPRWRIYLQLKSERSIDSNIKPRQDTLWKKILRDVREFFRILFRSRFHYLEFKDHKGATICIQTFFDELGIPITFIEALDYKLFRFVHQTHKLKISEKTNLEQSPFESIENFNETYKKLFMTNFTCARMFCFVFQSFLEEYSIHIKSRYKKIVLTMICMALNCYKRMSSYHHINRICCC